jgi:hypothetical protein
VIAVPAIDAPAAAAVKAVWVGLQLIGWKPLPAAAEGAADLAAPRGPVAEFIVAAMRALAASMPLSIDERNLKATATTTNAIRQRWTTSTSAVALRTTVRVIEIHESRNVDANVMRMAQTTRLTHHQRIARPPGNNAMTQATLAPENRATNVT